MIQLIVGTAVIQFGSTSCAEKFVRDNRQWFDFFGKESKLLDELQENIRIAKENVIE